MKCSYVRVVSSILVVCMTALPLQAQAGLIGTGEAVAAAQAQAARAAVAGFVDRAEAAGQLQALGLSPQAARQRVAALTDAEAAALADRINGLPAGAGGQGIGFILVAIFLFWRFVLSEPAQAETAKPKPAPEKK